MYGFVREHRSTPWNRGHDAETLLRTSTFHMEMLYPLPIIEEGYDSFSSLPGCGSEHHMFGISVG
ncbi:hypothetical protein NQ318_004286 [Aromia moschata]|uniref:Uncharacterized protein n=1 Tax=Aromia moschata TaxID=1265417 RepID=A0AAV8YTJ4_9CUCU|nr:hypothetical protein NQ318_004286 [Aromia moschata]